MDVNFYGYEGTATGGEFVVQLSQGFCGDGGCGGESSPRGFAEFGLHAADDGDEAGGVLEMSQEKFAGGGFGEREEGAGMDRAEVIEILRAGGKLKGGRLGGGLDAEEGVPGEFADGFHDRHSETVLTILRAAGCGRCGWATS